MPVRPPPWFNQRKIADRVRDLRLDKGLTQGALAKRIGMVENTLHMKETARNPFQLDELSAIAAVLEAPDLWPFVDLGDARLIKQMRREWEKREADAHRDGDE